MLLDRRQHVGEHRGAARPGDYEEIWETGDAKAEISLRPFAPLLLERLAAGALMSIFNSAPVMASKKSTGAAGGKDVFVHVSPLERSGLTSISEGQPVVVDVIEGRKGVRRRREFA